MTSVVAALVEAWGEVRVHRLRVVLSLVGVFLAVFALTTATAVGQMGTQVVAEAVERSSGRPATLAVDVYETGGQPLDAAEAETALRDVVERYDVRWASVVRYVDAQLEVAHGLQPLQVTAVDPEYGEMHRIAPTRGRWFEPSDAESYAPVMVVNESLAGMLDQPPPGAAPTVRLAGEAPTTATVVGVLPDQGGGYPQAWMLHEHAERWVVPPVGAYPQAPRLELWVPDADAEALTERVRSELLAVLGGSAALDPSLPPPVDVQVNRMDLRELDVIVTVLQWGVRGVGLFGLALGGIGVLNVALVTVRQRIREIGVRRSFGATSGRVFTTVVLESACATAAAGALAVALSVALVSNVPVVDLLPAEVPLDDVPPFPVAAAVEGFVAATIVGALAGAVPALIAVRARVIDAIRY